MTPAPAAPIPLRTAASAPKRGDFADWLSPILVKELRQGLQSKLFVSAFVLLQAAMVLFVGLGLISVTEDRNSSGFIFQGFFQVCVWVPLLIFMPARGLRAIGDETRAQTLDLVQLTRMSSFRIVWGKWLALVAQTCLLASAMLPYAVLQYYFGKVDVVGELVWFATLLLGSMVLTAAAVGLSSAHVGVRALVLLMVLPSTFTIGGFNYFFLRGISGAAAFSFSGLGEAALWIIPSAALYIYFFLELGASKIAPLAENHSARKRFLVLVLAAVIAGAGWCCSDEVVFAFLGIFAPIIGFVVLEALCEMPVLMPGIYRPFAMRGIGGRLLGRLFYPGWASGVIFAAVVHALLWIGLAGAYRKTISSEIDQAIFRAIAPMVFAALVSPLPLLQLFPRLTRRFWPYMLVQVLCVLLFTIATIISQAHHGDLNGPFMLLAPCPTAALLALLSHSDQKDLAKWILDFAPLADVILFIWLGVLMLRQFSIIRKMENLSLGRDQAATEASA